MDKEDTEEGVGASIHKDPTTVQLKAPDERNHRPEWVRKLLEYYKYLQEDMREVKENGKARNRLYFTLQCKLCEASHDNSKTRQLKTAKRKTIGRGKEQIENVITGSGTFPFSRHLQVLK